MRFVAQSRSMVFFGSFSRLIRGYVTGPGSHIIEFNNPNYKLLPTDKRVDEEGHDISRYYPMRIGDTIENQYQIVGKLGFGVGSTVWLANDFK